MIKKILWWILACLIIVFVIIWIWTGGLGRAWDTAKSFTNIVDFLFYKGDSTGVSLRLPWQPELPTGYSPSQLGLPGDNSSKDQNEFAALSDEYDRLNSQVAESKTFGDPSPFKGQMYIIRDANAREDTPQAEYIEIATGVRNTAPVDMSGWSLQSAYTGVRAYIPQGAPQFLMGVINNIGPIQLSPGESAVINSGLSPVGVSFRENLCTGYLAQLQVFTPSLSSLCPSPRSELSMTPDNLRNYGESCFDFLQTLPACEAPLNNMPPNITPNCRAFASDVFSYNGCVTRNRAKKSFFGSSWRIYLASNTELWRNSHDIIRLLDAEGRTVDVVTY